MTTAEIAPPLLDAGPPAAVRRGRHSPRRSAVFASLAVVALGAAGTALWVANWYQPLYGGSGAYGAGVMVAGGYQSEAIQNAFGTEFQAMNPSRDDEIGMLFTLTNDGPFAVTVVDVAQPFSTTEMSDANGVDYSAGHATRTTDETGQRWEPLTPFSIPAGGHAQIQILFDAADCVFCMNMSPGASTSVTTVPVTIRELGHTRTEEVPLGYAFTIGALPPDTGAPR